MDQWDKKESTENLCKDYLHVTTNLAGRINPSVTSIIKSIVGFGGGMYSSYYYTLIVATPPSDACMISRMLDIQMLP